MVQGAKVLRKIAALSRNNFDRLFVHFNSVNIKNN